MNNAIEKSGTGIERSGTGIERSGTGIERSGTGIERSGTGSKLKSAAMHLVAAIALTSTFSVNALEPQLLVTRNADNILISVHSGQSILVGHLALQGGSGEYLSVNLYETTLRVQSGATNNGLMTQGSGGGTPSSFCKVDGSGLMTQGSGGGTPGSFCRADGSGLMTQGSGGGTPGSFCKTGGSGLMTQGSGGGSAGSGEDDCMNKSIPWGSAELVFDSDGTSIIVHRNGPTGPEEFMVEFIAGTASLTGEPGSNVISNDQRIELRSITRH